MAISRILCHRAYVSGRHSTRICHSVCGARGDDTFVKQRHAVAFLLDVTILDDTI